MKSFISIIFLAGYCILLISCKTNAVERSDAQAKNNMTTILYLARHAEKADDGTSDPDLTKEGVLRAKRLSEILEHENISHIFSSNYKRTIQTASPLAEVLGLEIEIYDPGDFSSLLAFIDEHPGSNLLIVGHSNTTPDLCNTLIEENKYDQFDESDYGNLIKVVLKGELKSAQLIRF